MTDTMLVRLATPADLPAIHHLYLRVIEEQETVRHHPCWRKGVYPEKVYLGQCIEAQELWVAEIQGVIAGAIVINEKYHEQYTRAPWACEALHGEFCVLHTLAVSPSFRRRGVADALLTRMKALASSWGKKSLRVDVIDNNLPIEPLYLRHGFQRCTAMRMYYDAVGWQLFHLYELPLS